MTYIHCSESHSRKGSSQARIRKKLCSRVSDRGSRYHISYLLREDPQQTSVTVSTTVHYNTWRGLAYFAAVRPFHRVLVPFMVSVMIEHAKRSRAEERRENGGLTGRSSGPFRQDSAPSESLLGLDPGSPRHFRRSQPRPFLTIRGAIETEHTFPLSALDELPRSEMVADFHCVTT